MGKRPPRHPSREVPGSIEPEQDPPDPQLNLWEDDGGAQSKNPQNTGESTQS
jgi:hypothetical protein